MNNPKIGKVYAILLRAPGAPEIGIRDNGDIEIDGERETRGEVVMKALKEWGVAYSKMHGWGGDE